MNRAVVVLALAACGSGQPATHTGERASSGSANGSATGGGDYPPAQFKPPTEGLAVGIAQFVVIDENHSQVFVRRNKGIDVLKEDTSKLAGRIELGWDGELYPAQPNVLAMRTDGNAIQVVLVDPETLKAIGTCRRSVQIPAGSVISRVDEFTTHAGTTYLKWETSPPPQFHGGAAMSDEQIAKAAQDFQAAYACGLLAVHPSATGCALDPATYQDAGLESCETRMMPWPRYLPTPQGGLALKVERSSTQRGGLYIDIETLIFSAERSGEELWRLPIETRAVPPPPP